MNYNGEYRIPAGTTTLTVKGAINRIEEEYEVSDFGLQINGRNIFYVLYLKDKLSYRRGFSIMIGDRVILDWDNCKR